MRYAISSPEEVWVRVCSEFFLRHGSWNWYQIPKEQAFHEMMKASNGQANPSDFKKRIDCLYESVGVK